MEQDIWELFSSKGILALYNSGGCTCCYQYVKHLLNAEEHHSLNQSNGDIEVAVMKALPELVNQLRQDRMDSVTTESHELNDKLVHQKQKVANFEKSYRNKHCWFTYYKTKYRGLCSVKL
jgi:hypothetical protein